MQQATSKVFEAVHETHDTVSLRFERPEGLNYQPGQYGLFEREINGEVVKRSYSFSSSPTEDFLQITVKHMFHGKMSTVLTDLHEGAELKFTAPLGKFTLDENLKDVVFIAGGSGISPFRCMLKYAFDKNLDMNIKLIYGCRGPHDIILDKELHEWNESQDNFNLFITIDKPHPEWNHHVGFIDANFIKQSTNDHVHDKIYFICGPPPMVNSVKKALLNMDVADENIKLDAWG